MYSEFPAEDLAQQIYRESLIQQVRYISPLEEETSNIFGWKWSFTVAVQAISRDIAGELRNVEDEVTQDFSVARQSAEEGGTWEKLYTLLALLCKDETTSYLRTAEDGDGLHALQALLRQKKPFDFQ